MTDDDEVPAAVGQDLDAASKLLEAQGARIAALRVAVLSGRVPDQDNFDYARFFGDLAKDEPPEG